MGKAATSSPNQASTASSSPADASTNSSNSRPGVAEERTESVRSQRVQALGQVPHPPAYQAHPPYAQKTRTVDSGYGSLGAPSNEQSSNIPGTTSPSRAGNGGREPGQNSRQIQQKIDEIGVVTSYSGGAVVSGDTVPTEHYAMDLDDEIGLDEEVEPNGGDNVIFSEWLEDPQYHET
ncbi:hypothetical protein ACHAQH_006713 [Verticillium albo-atrum]